jgi:homoserine O-succinyltransferase/O-acetyltransferase
MPVLIDRGPRGARLFAATEERRGIKPPEFEPANPGCIELALVNNMPDLALEQTERQIVQLLDAAGTNLLVRLSYYSLPEVPRGEWGHRHLSRLHYHYIDELWDHKLDGLIVTGTEPRTPDLRMEPYWHTLTKVLDWADGNTISTVASCLAVHAAVLYFDGIDRRPLNQKCFGVFDFESVSDSPLLSGAPPRFQMPHSRWNEISEDALKSSGYNVLTRSDRHGVDTFVKRKRSLFIFFQGHPEYEAWTLFGEYRRDVARYLAGEREIYPEMPHGYFGHESMRLLEAFRERALDGPHKELIATFPGDQLTGKLTDTWRATAIITFANWLRYIVAQKAQRIRPACPFVTEGLV